MSESKTSVNRLAALEKQRQALDFRRAGASYEFIAGKLGYKSASGAYAAVRSAIRAVLKEPADEVRKLETDRLDRLLLGIWKKALDGDLECVDRVLKIMKRRAELEGLDAPRKIAPTTPDGAPAFNIDSIVQGIIKAEELLAAGAEERDKG